MASSSSRPTNSHSDGAGLVEKSYFEQQREVLVGEISISLERVLQNFNKLNRTLEGVIDVGHEFGSVEALWSQFENVMAKEPEAGEGTGPEDEGAGSMEQKEKAESTKR